LGAVLAAAAVVLALSGGSPAGAAGRSVAPHADKSHPFSNPVWYPLTTASAMNCMKDNPGCPPSQVQNYWGWDITANREPAGEYHQKVYAMGAGIVHVLAHGKTCGSDDENRGNSIYIDHGAGVISMYSHLAPDLLVHDGDYVSARTAIAYVGNSGYTKCAAKPEVRFLAVVVMHNAKPTKSGGIAGDYTQVTHTYACVSGEKVNWPHDLPRNDGSWHHWHDVPLGTDVPATSHHRACIPTPPATAPYPHDAKLRKSASTTLKGSWVPARGKYHVHTVLAQLQQYHPSIHAWTDERSHELKGGAGSTHFTKLNRNGKYRMKVWFKNNVGWSKPSPWVARAL
jgi:murein DD-endopeptidase MepM/ murein hydrolase activator NlpD